MKRLALASCTFSLGLAAIAPAQVGVAAPISPNAAHRAISLRSGHPMPVTVHKMGGSSTLVALGTGLVLRLKPHSVRARNFRLRAQGKDGRWTDVAPGPVRTFRGTILGQARTRVAASILDDGVYARVFLPSGLEFWIQPAPRMASARGGTHVLYRSSDVVQTKRGCGTHLLGNKRPVLVASVDKRSKSAGPLAIKEAELACDAAFEYFSDYGTTAATSDRIQSVINTMNLQYERDVSITHKITSITVRTSSNQPYTSTDANTLLNQFRDEWNANQTGVHRDIAQLFTGKEIAGGTIGIAWLGVICHGSYGYGLVQSDFNGNFSSATDLSAHELGHNWDADHCRCRNYTMNPYITSANVFSPRHTIREIEAHRDSRTCLTGGSGGNGTCSVNSIVVAKVPFGKNKERAQATVIIVDGDGNRLANATVTGNFSGAYVSNGEQATTDGNGVAVLTARKSGSGSTVTFCVTAVTAANHSYDSNANVETCDSAN